MLSDDITGSKGG